MYVFVDFVIEVYNFRILAAILFYTLLQDRFCLGERSSDLDNMHSLYGP